MISREGEQLCQETILLKIITEFAGGQAQLANQLSEELMCLELWFIVQCLELKDFFFLYG